MHEHASVDNNGGYDSAVWGKVDVNDWTTSAYHDDNNPNVILKITGYKGTVQLDDQGRAKDLNVIIPNSQGFINAGIIKPGQEVGIDSFSSLTVDNDGTPVGLLNVLDNTYMTDPQAGHLNTFAVSKTGNAKIVYLGHAIGYNQTSNSEIAGMMPDFAERRFNHALIDVANVDTRNVTDLYGAFEGFQSEKTALDLSGWGVSHVTNFSDAFSGGSGGLLIAGLNLSNWNLIQRVKGISDHSNNLFNRSSAFLDIGELRLANMKFPQTTITIDDDNGKQIQIHGGIVPAIWQFVNNGDGNTLGQTKLIDLSGDDLTGLTYDLLAAINRQNEITPIFVQGAKLILNNVSNVPPLSPDAKIKAVQVPNGDSIFDYMTAQWPHTGITFETNNDHLLQSLGSANYREMKALRGTSQRTINFNFPASFIKAHPEIAKQVVQKIDTYQRHAIIDNDSKKIVGYTDWQNIGKEQQFAVVTVPQISGYQASMATVAAQPAQVGDQIVVNVDYQPTEQADDERQAIVQNSSAQPLHRVNESKQDALPSTTVPQGRRSMLPQTGSNDGTSVAVLGVAAMLTLLGLSGKKQKKQ